MIETKGTTNTTNTVNCPESLTEKQPFSLKYRTHPSSNWLVSEQKKAAKTWHMIKLCSNQRLANRLHRQDGIKIVSYLQQVAEDYSKRSKLMAGPHSSEKLENSS